ncbi:hypothetical protein LEN26_003844, partial [Aphanomyces euteiches]
MASKDFSAFRSPDDRSRIIDDVDHQRHPIETANWVTKVLLLWVDPLILKGAKTPLTPRDTWKLRHQDTAACLHERFQTEWTIETHDQPTSPSFARALGRTLLKPTLNVTLGYAVYATLMLVQPSVIKTLVNYLQGKDNSADTGWAYGMAATLAVLAFISVTLMDYSHSLTVILGCNAKSIVMDAVFLKAISIPTVKSSGQVVTLVTIDSERLFAAYFTLPWIIVAPLTLLAIFVLIGIELGVLPSLVGGSAILGMLYLASRVAAEVGRIRGEIASVQANRVKLTNELLQGVRVVKMYGWEQCLEDEIERMRSKELALLKRFQIRRLLNDAMLAMAPVIALALCLAVYVAQDNVLTPAVAFTTLAYINVSRLPCTVFGGAVMSMSEAFTSCTRIGTFLQEAQVSTRPRVAHPSCLHDQVLARGSYRWQQDEPATLHDIDLVVEPRTLVMVVGPVGSGKSSLVRAILGEMHNEDGHEKGLQFAYASQDPWIQQDSVKANILFSRHLHEERYDCVLSACQLQADLATFPQDDETEIGERGLNLSGGQKARVGLARALYDSSADIYLLDDPLSALDSKVATAVFRDGIQRLLGEKTVVLVLNSHYHLLRFAQRILVMEDGHIVGDGSFESLRDRFPHLFEHSTVVDPPPDDMLGTPSPFVNKPQDGALVAAEERKQGHVTFATYLKYFGSTGWNGYFVLSTVVASFVLAQLGLVLTDWYMGRWSARSSSSSTAATHVLIYLGLAFLSMGLLWSRSIYLLFLSTNCSKQLHRRVFHSVLHAPVHTFFDVTPVGRILNRFSSDLDQVDSMLPYAGVFFLNFMIQTVAVLIVCSVSAPFILVLYVPLVVVFYKIQAYFNRTAVELKRMDSVARSPVVNLVSEALAGLATIRAFNKTATFVSRNRDAIDHAQNLMMLHRTIYRWLEMRLDWLCTVVVAGVAFVLVASKASLGITAAGLGLTYASQMSICLSRLVIGASLTDNLITCVERLDEYAALDHEGENDRLPSESSLEKMKPWPFDGNVSFESYSMRYRDHLDLVLRDVSFVVNGGEKVGICGRTGSGKSSLMVALFRMVEASSGCIKIDGVGISQVNLQTLRSRLTIIPQD